MVEQRLQKEIKKAYTQIARCNEAVWHGICYGVWPYVVLLLGLVGSAITFEIYLRGGFMTWMYYFLGGLLLGLGIMAYFTVWAFRDRIHSGLRGFTKGSGKPDPTKKESE